MLSRYSQVHPERLVAQLADFLGLHLYHPGEDVAFLLGDALVAPVGDAAGYVTPFADDLSTVDGGPRGSWAHRPAAVGAAVASLTAIAGVEEAEERAETHPHGKTKDKTGN